MVSEVIFALLPKIKEGVTQQYRIQNVWTQNSARNPETACVPLAKS